MELLDSLIIHHEDGPRSIELWQGDLAVMSPREAVDVLVVSAYRDNYLPTDRSLVGALHRAGVSVEKLADDKQEDMRESCSCWLSKEIEAAGPGMQFQRIICFEPVGGGSPADAVGDVFRSLVPFVIGGERDKHVEQVAMPLVSTGDVGASIAEMTEALFTAAAGWMEHGLPLKRLKIVELSPLKAAEVKGAFSILKRQYLRKKASQKHTYEYDLFISYCHKNAPEADRIEQHLRALNPKLRIFIDHRELAPGVAWHDKLYRSIDSSKKVLALFTPEYVNSKACLEEFNFSSLLHSRNGEKTLFPILLYNADLLPHMSRWQYVDCRVADQAKMEFACQKLLEELEKHEPAPAPVSA